MKNISAGAQLYKSAIQQIEFWLEVIKTTSSKVEGVEQSESVSSLWPSMW
jgi:hypothetical protein